jgi:hypothetical protein
MKKKKGPIPSLDWNKVGETEPAEPGVYFIGWPYNPPNSGSAWSGYYSLWDGHEWKAARGTIKGAKAVEERSTWVYSQTRSIGLIWCGAK